MDGESRHVNKAADRERRLKPWLRAALSCAVIIFLTTVMLGRLTKLVERKDSYKKYAPFFQQETDYDVLLLGTSHVIEGVFPMDLWKDYGIVSYNCGGSANTLAVTNWVFENVLNYTTPRVVLLDCLRLSIDVPINGVIENTHISFDAFPVSFTKMMAAMDLTDTKERCTELLFDFSIYHDRWSDIGKNDFVPAISPEKGADSKIAVADGDFHKIDNSQYLREDTLGVHYLRRILRTCQERGIPVLLTFLPFPASETEQKEANRVAQIAKEYSVDYINFLDLDVVDYDTDCFDSNSHLNPSGARKVTDYLGRYIMVHYDVPDRRGDPAYAGWNADYAAYTKFKVDNLAGQTDLKNYLMLLHDKHLSSCVYLTENNLWHGDSIYDKLLANMGVNSKSLVIGGPTLAVADTGGGER